MQHLADFFLQERPKDNLMAISRAWHGVMADIQWPLSQSKLWNCIIQSRICIASAVDCTNTGATHQSYRYGR